MSVTTNANGHHRLNGHATPPAPSAPVSDGAGRTANGKFAAGNKLGKGNPFARRLGALRSAFLDAVSAADVQAVARQLLRQALSGDTAAASLFLAYACGKAGKSPDVDRLDLDEVALLRESPTADDFKHLFASHLDAGAVARVLSHYAPDVFQGLALEWQATRGRPGKVSAVARRLAAEAGVSEADLLAMAAHVRAAGITFPGEKQED